MNAVYGANEELHLDIPVGPADDMKRHLKKWNLKLKSLMVCSF